MTPNIRHRLSLHHKRKSYDRSNKSVKDKALRYGLRQIYPKYRPRCMLLKNAFYQSDGNGKRGTLESELTKRFFKILKAIAITKFGVKNIDVTNLKHLTMNQVKIILQDENKEHTFGIEVTKRNRFKIFRERSRRTYNTHYENLDPADYFPRDDRRTSLKVAFEENYDFVVQYLPSARSSRDADLLIVFKKVPYVPRLPQAKIKGFKEKAKELKVTYQYEPFLP